MSGESHLAGHLYTAHARHTVVQVSSPEHLQEQLSIDLNRVSVLSFHAEWAEPCKQMNEVVRELAKKYPQALFLEVRRPRRLHHSEIITPVRTD
jgi:thiol-disulfide isomerase/thioredoxin